MLDVGLGRKRVPGHESLHSLTGVLFLLRLMAELMSNSQTIPMNFPVRRHMHTIEEDDGDESVVVHGLGKKSPHETDEPEEVDLMFQI